MRRPDLRGDEGSLPIALLLSVVTAGVSLLILTGSLQMIRDTRSEIARSAALNAARAGLAGALANLRSAVDSTGAGKASLLPCGGVGVPQLAGTSGDSATYQTSISYLSVTPLGKPAAWIAANSAPCTTVIPKFAYLSATGTAAGVSRTLFATYTFKTLLKGNAPGGQIKLLKPDSTDDHFCMDAGSGLAGVVVTMQECDWQADGTPIPGQQFGYQPNLTLSLITADPVAYPNGLCLDAGTPHTTGSPVRLQPCGAATLIQQQWSFDTSSSFFGTTDGKTLDDYCITMATPGKVSDLVLNDTSNGLHNGDHGCGNALTGYQNWSPTPSVGAGAAGLPSTKQLVNFERFGRCLDVTYQSLLVPYEVAFPCKQQPDPTVRDWNQAWNIPNGLGRLSVQSPDNGLQCLTAHDLTQSPLLLSMSDCAVGTVPDTQMFNYRGQDTPSYDEAYRMEGTGSYAGLCLQPLPDYPAWAQADKIGLRPCSGARIQKWNALPASTQSAFAGVGEK